MACPLLIMEAKRVAFTRRISGGFKVSAAGSAFEGGETSGIAAGISSNVGESLFSFT